MRLTCVSQCLYMLRCLEPTGSTYVLRYQQIFLKTGRLGPTWVSTAHHQQRNPFIPSSRNYKTMFEDVLEFWSFNVCESCEHAFKMSGKAIAWEKWSPKDWIDCITPSSTTKLGGRSLPQDPKGNWMQPKTLAGGRRVIVISARKGEEDAHRKFCS